MFIPFSLDQFALGKSGPAHRPTLTLAWLCPATICYRYDDACDVLFFVFFVLFKKNFLFLLINASSFRKCLFFFSSLSRHATNMFACCVCCYVEQVVYLLSKPRKYCISIRGIVGRSTLLALRPKRGGQFDGAPNLPSVWFPGAEMPECPPNP